MRVQIKKQQCSDRYKYIMQNFFLAISKLSHMRLKKPC